MPDVDMRVDAGWGDSEKPGVRGLWDLRLRPGVRGSSMTWARLGGICAKGLTLHRREGNPGPRIAETPMGILNSVGLQNPGGGRLCCETELPFLRQYDVKVIANISGNTPEEYGIMCEKLAQKPGWT